MLPLATTTTIKQWARRETSIRGSFPSPEPWNLLVNSCVDFRCKIVQTWLASALNSNHVRHLGRLGLSEEQKPSFVGRRQTCHVCRSHQTSFLGGDKNLACWEHCGIREKTLKKQWPPCKKKSKDIPPPKKGFSTPKSVRWQAETV